MYVDGVESPLIVLKANRGGCDSLIVLGTNDDDDQIFLLEEETTQPQARVNKSACHSAIFILVLQLKLLDKTRSLLQQEKRKSSKRLPVAGQITAFKVVWEERLRKR